MTLLKRKSSLDPWEEQRRSLALRRNAGNVTAAARECGIPYPTMLAFARRRGLNRKGKGINAALDAKEIRHRLLALLRARSDKDAAKLAKRNPSTMRVWRERHGLPSPRELNKDVNEWPIGRSTRD